jgi:spore maturation protein CgeB
VTRLRWLIIGDCAHDIYERSLVRGLHANGIDASSVSYVSHRTPSGALKLGLKHPNLPLSLWIERRIARTLNHYRPTHVLVWRGEPLAPRSIERLRRRLPSAKWCYYTNDFLFAPEDRHRWDFVHGGLRLYDHVLVYRELDRNLLRERLGIHSQVWLPGYDPELLGTEAGPPAVTRAYDLVFVGHNETDGRIDLLLRLASAGIRLSIRGPGWTPIPGVDVGSPVYGNAYADAIRSARMALVLLSRRNRDEITRRCFEIPYVGTTMLAPRTPLMLSLFRDGRECVYFDSPDDAPATLLHHLADPARLDRIAAAARARVDEIGGGIAARAAELVGAVT